MATRAAAKGRGWLRLTQLKNGAWAEFNDYLPEPFVGTVFAPATAEQVEAFARRHYHDAAARIAYLSPP